MWLFISSVNLWKTVQSKCFTKPQEVHLEDLMSTDSSGSCLNKFSLNSSLIIMPVTIWWIGSVSWMISKQRNTENFCEGETTRIRLPDSLISKFLSQKCYDKPELSRVKFACLVCGFSDSCLTGKKQEAFLPCLSHCAFLAVVQGAVMFET